MNISKLAMVTAAASIVVASCQTVEEPSCDACECGPDSFFDFYQESPLPAGVEVPAAFGQVEIRSYPVMRQARIEDSNGFMSLFFHIQRESIPMTTPVIMEGPDEDRPRNSDAMAFLYPDASTGAVGLDDRNSDIEVSDLPESTWLVYGFNGRSNASAVAKAKGEIAAFELPEGWRITENDRIMGYNSPMVSASRSYWEYQVEVVPQ